MRLWSARGKPKRLVTGMQRSPMVSDSRLTSEAPETEKTNAKEDKSVQLWVQLPNPTRHVGFKLPKQQQQRKGIL